MDGPGSDRTTRRVHVDISGRVQGVFFRASCAEHARRLGLSGWVRNAAGGGVEAAFEGPVDRVQSMIAWCREGPALASVDRIEVSEEAPTGEPAFRVVR